MKFPESSTQFTRRGGSDARSWISSSSRLPSATRVFGLAHSRRIVRERCPRSPILVSLDAWPANNPLILAALIALLVCIGALYQLIVEPHLNPLHLVRLLAFAAFLVLYLLKSRFAWHVFGIAILIITPAYVLLPRLQSHSVRPETLAALLFLSSICVVYLWRVRSPYFRFIEHDGTQPAAPATGSLALRVDVDLDLD